MHPADEKNFPISASLAAARRKQAATLALLEALVRMESPSDDKTAVDACVAFAAREAEQRGGRIKIHRNKTGGNLLEARFGPRPTREQRPVLLLGHLDTVWPVGTLQKMPWKLVDGRLSGPGVLDMKAGVAMALGAVEMLAEVGLLRRPITLLLTGDEEVGSPGSRAWIEKLAAESEAVYVLEAAQGLAYKTARKGTGTFRVDVTGVAAHSGVDFGKGASAILELARVIETVSGWTDLPRGLTLNVGVAGGGSKTNVVAEHAWCEVDVRIARKADGLRMERKFATLRAKDNRCAITVSGGMNRPPMERKAGTVKLLRRAQAHAAKLGFVLDEASTGGASDGNFTAALGIPTLDGMGAVGAGAHAAHEHLLVEHLAPRTALLAAMLL